MDVVTYALCKKLAKSAISGIKNIQVQGLDLIIETNDGNIFTIHFPTPADGLDGKDGNSVLQIQIDSDNHLICTMSDGTIIDAGEIQGIGGGLTQANRKEDFPIQGKEDTLYLAKDKEELYYWNGTKYQPIVSSNTDIFAELKTGDIVFDGINDTFTLPIDDVNINVYVNGLYLSENDDYTIDRSVKPNKIKFNIVYDTFDICKLTYLKPVTGSGEGLPPVDVDLDFATNEDIDSLFDNDEEIVIPGGNLDFATNEDIDSLFDNDGDVIIPDNELDFATNEDIDSLFKGGDA